VKDLEAALEINGNDPQVLYKLGLTCFANEKYKKAVNNLKRALMAGAH